jgi:hypothetical protein
MGLGTERLRAVQLEWTRVVREQSRVGAELGESPGVCASVVGAAL